MSTIGISAGLKALLAAQSSLDTVGNNLANINTPGYSRQRVDLATGANFERYGLLLGAGVDTLGVSRAFDGLLEQRIYSQLGLRSKLEQRFESASEIQDLFGELQGVGIGQKLDAFFAAVSQLGASPSDGILQSDLIQSSVGLSQRFHEISSGLSDMQGNLGDMAKEAVQEVNSLTQQIASLSQQISTVEPGVGPANNLRDQRQELVKQLAELVEVQVRENEHGQFNVYVESNLLVSADRALRLELVPSTDGAKEVHLEGAAKPLKVKSGRLGAMLAFDSGQMQSLKGGLDTLAKSIIYKVNQNHSTGIPSSGAFHALTGANPLIDQNGSGTVLDDRLADSGLPFEVLDGKLRVNLVDEKTGDITSHELEIDHATTTVGDFLAMLNGISGLTASLDGDNRLNISAGTGLGFDFSNRLDPNPNAAGTFGGANANLGSKLEGPYNLPPGSTLQWTQPAGSASNYSVSFDAANFPNPEAVSAEELATFLNAEGNFAAAGMQAVAVGEALHLVSTGSGPSASFEISGGTGLAALGLDSYVGQAQVGSDQGVAVKISGEYAGAAAHQYTFVAVGDGTIGTTPDLAVEVYDEQGGLVAALEVGEGYVPGAVLEVAEGVKVSFGLGEIKSSTSQRFALSTTADSDTTDVLVAFGLNSFFVGNDAETIAVHDNLEDDPSFLATSWNGSGGGNQALLALLDAQKQDVQALEGQTLNDGYNALVSDVGFEMSSLDSSLTTADMVLQSLEARRASVSGVNSDEELVDLVKFQQAYATAAQYLSVVGRLEEDLLNIL